MQVWESNVTSYVSRRIVGALLGECEPGDTHFQSTTVHRQLSGKYGTVLQQKKSI